MGEILDFFKHQPKSVDTMGYEEITTHAAKMQQDFLSQHTKSLLANMYGKFFAVLPEDYQAQMKALVSYGEADERLDVYFVETMLDAQKTPHAFRRCLIEMRLQNINGYLLDATWNAWNDAPERNLLIGTTRCPIRQLLQGMIETLMSAASMGEMATSAYWRQQEGRYDVLVHTDRVGALIEFQFDDFVTWKAIHITFDEPFRQMPVR